MRRVFNRDYGRYKKGVWADWPISTWRQFFKRKDFNFEKDTTLGDDVDSQRRGVLPLSGRLHDVRRSAANG